MIEAKEIMNILPHAYPFLLVDRILEIELESGSSASRMSPITNLSSRAISQADRSCLGF